MAALRCYASGSGALSFVFESNGVALPERVEKYHAEVYMIQERESFSDYILTENSAGALLIPDVKRVNDCTYLFAEREYIERGGAFYVYCEHEKVREWLQVKNISTLGALKFFIENEKTHYIN